MTKLPKIGAPALRALSSKGIENLEGLARYSETEISTWHGVGPYALRLLKEALANSGLSYKS